MDKGSRPAIMGRALLYGACMGALTGGPVFGATFVVAAVIGGARMLAAGLAVTVVGGVVGGVVGLIAAVLPGLVLASLGRNFYRHHPRIARACAAAISGLEVDTPFVVGHGGIGGATATGGSIAFLVFAFALFAAVGGYSLNYVIAGRKCAPARRALQCLRRMCPCGRFRGNAMSVAC